MTSVLLPEPETPVTQVNTPIGNETLRFLRLFSDAPSIFINPFGFLLLSGIGMVYSLERYFPVSDLSFFKKLSLELISLTILSLISLSLCESSRFSKNLMHSSTVILDTSCIDFFATRIVRHSFFNREPSQAGQGTKRKYLPSDSLTSLDSVSLYHSEIIPITPGNASQ